MLTPWNKLQALQDSEQFTELMVVSEELKTMPWGEVWEEFCNRNAQTADGWFAAVKEYENNVLAKRG